MQHKRHIICFVYNSYRDPLCSGLMVKYIKDLDQSGCFFHLITFEQPSFALDETSELKEKEKLLAQNIQWYPLRFKTGRLLLFKKLLNLFSAFFLLLRLKIKYRPELIIAFANVAASMSYVCSRILRIPLCIFSFEPHSEFLAELGMWNRKGIKYRIMHSLEWKAGLNAKYVFTGTRYMVDHLKSLGARGVIKKLPTGIDSDFFQFDEKKRIEIRTDLGLRDRPVLIYPGKFGDLYIKEEMAELCSMLIKHRPDFFFIFLTGTDRATIINWFDQHGISPESILVKKVAYEEVPGYLSAADIGVVGIANFPSRKYCSPTKVGEYLMCGLPYIVQENTSEDDVVARKHEVGAVIRSFRKEDAEQSWNTIEQLLTENKDQLRKRCRETGLLHRSKSAVKKEFSEMLRIPFPPSSTSL